MKWKLYDTPEDKIREYARSLNMPSVLAAILINRGMPIDTAKKLLYNPDVFITNRTLPIHHIEQVSQYVINNLAENRKLCVFADYDVDGLSSGYIARVFFNMACHIPTEVYYPERAEGYGISFDYCNTLMKKYLHTDELKPLVMTVDNGITKKDEVQILLDAGFPVLVTDHHLVIEGKKPNTVCFDPFDNPTPVGQNLCGAGVIWSLCRQIEYILSKRECEWTDYLIHAVALATIADMVPLDLYNMALIIKGMVQINDGFAPAWTRVLRDNFCHGHMDPDSVSWEISPLLNSCGRMGDVNLGAELMKQENEDKAIVLASRAKEYNAQRKDLLKEAVIEVQDHLLTKPKDEIIIAMADAYPVGMHGLIASKLSEQTGKPTFAVRNTGKNGLGGSARSSTVPLTKLVDGEKEKGTILSFGGHAFSAGISINADKKDEFIHNLNQKIRDMKQSGEFKKYGAEEKELRIDATISLSDITNNNRCHIQWLPYDKNMFPQPYIMIPNVDIKNISHSRNNPDNICLSVKDESVMSPVDIWAWNYWNTFKENIGDCKRVHLAGQLVRDFRRPSRTTFRIVDIKKAIEGDNTVEEIR